MIEMRFHGRGGQGTVKGCQVLVKTLVSQGKFAQFIPAFGVERKGSPVYGYMRLDDKEIRYNCQVYHPDIVIVSDASLMKVIDVLDGSKEGTKLIVNSKHSPKDISVKAGVEVFTVDASSIAENILGVEIPNTTMLGSIAKILDSIDKNILREQIIKSFNEKNALAFDMGYDQLNSVL